MGVRAITFSYSGEIEDRILAKAAADDEFRARLTDDPKAVIAREFGINLPERFDIRVHENTPTTRHLVLPQSELLAESDLELVAGGEGMPSGPPPSPPEQDFPG